MNLKLSSEKWCKLLDVWVIDPDGWNRKDFTASWNEPIDFETFVERSSVSTTESHVPLTREYMNERIIKILES